MKTSSFFKLSVSLAVITFAGVFSGYVSAPDLHKNPAIEAQASPQLLKVKSATKGYVVKEKDGFVAIYSRLENNALNLYEEYDIPVSLLPKADRTALQNGIDVNSLSDALVMIENFSG